MASFADRVVLITGAGNGIGRELSRQLTAEGARVGAIDRDAAALDALAGELKGKHLAVALADVTDLPALRAAASSVEELLGPTDLLIANAGIGRETAARRFRAEDWTAQINVNLIGVINSIDVVLPGMIARRAGHIAAMSSLASYRGMPRMGGYCASKAGVNAVFESLQVELRPLGIDVSTICPGWIRTALTVTAPIRAEMMDVAVAGRIILDALRARKSFHAFPARARWVLGLMRSLPRPVSDWMTARYARRQAKS